MAMMDTMGKLKFTRAKRGLGVSGPHLLGMLEVLWQYCHANCTTLDGVFFDRDDVEVLCEWDGQPGRLVAVLEAEGWLDRKGEKLVVHDYAQNAPQFVVRRCAREARTAAARAGVCSAVDEENDARLDMASQRLDMASRKERKGKEGKGREEDLYADLDKTEVCKDGRVGSGRSADASAEGDGERHGRDGQHGRNGRVRGGAGVVGEKLAADGARLIVATRVEVGSDKGAENGLRGSEGNVARFPGGVRSEEVVSAGAVAARVVSGLCGRGGPGRREALVEEILRVTGEGDVYREWWGETVRRMARVRGGGELEGWVRYAADCGDARARTAKDLGALARPGAWLGSKCRDWLLAHGERLPPPPARVLRG